MTIFLLPTTEKNAIPSAAESKALSKAYQHIAAGRIEEARKTLFAVFSPALAEMHYEVIRLRLTPRAPVISDPTPQHRPTPLPVLVRFGLALGLAFLVYSALMGR